MRHGKAGLKLGRTSSHRQAMFRNMVTSLFKYERIRTTDAKAKELRRWADHMITLAKRGDLHARRRALAVIREKKVVHKLFAEAPERFGKVSGGYTRVVKLGRRPGDSAAISIVELVSPTGIPKKEKKQPAPSAAVAPEPREAQQPRETPASESESVAPKAESEGELASKTESDAKLAPKTDADGESPSESDAGDAAEDSDKPS